MATVTVTFTITELCLRTGVSEEELTEIVGLGMIEPHQPQADALAVRRQRGDDCPSRGAPA